VAALGIVEALDVIEHVSFGFVTRAIGFALGSFGLQRGEEALHRRRVVPHVARPAHAADHAMIDQQALELLAGVLAALVGMMQQGVRFAATPDRHDQGIGDKLCRHARAHRPANDATGEQVNDHSYVEPAFRRPDIGEVSDPFAIGGGGFEAAVKNVRSDGGRLPLTLQPAPLCSPTPQRPKNDIFDRYRNSILYFVHFGQTKPPRQASSSLLA
jgi:hypothetical protein